MRELLKQPLLPLCLRNEDNQCSMVDLQKIGKHPYPADSKTTAKAQNQAYEMTRVSWLEAKARFKELGWHPAAGVVALHSPDTLLQPPWSYLWHCLSTLSHDAAFRRGPIAPGTHSSITDVLRNKTKQIKDISSRSRHQLCTHCTLTWCSSGAHWHRHCFCGYSADTSPWAQAVPPPVCLWYSHPPGRGAGTTGLSPLAFTAGKHSLG